MANLPDAILHAQFNEEIEFITQEGQRRTPVYLVRSPILLARLVVLVLF